MYVTQSNACSAPNSANPPTNAQIMRGVRILGSMEGKVRAARQAFNCLLYRDDLNTNGWPLADQGGTPSSTVTGCPSPQSLGAGAGAGNGVNLLGLQYWPSAVVTLQEPTALPSNSPATYPQPPAPTTPALTTQAHSAAAALLTTQAPATKPKFPTTGNLCLDIALNYVDPSQVSTKQLTDCAMKGYSGNKDGPLLTTPMIAWRNANYASLPKVPDNPNVPAFTPAIGQPYGMGSFDGCSFLTGLIASVGVATAGLYLFNQAKRMGYV